MNYPLPKNLKTKLFIITLSIFGSFLLISSKSYAATLSISPASGEVSGTFDSIIYVDPEGASISGVDAVIKYNPSFLEVQLIQDGSFEQYLKKNINKTTGTIEISAYNSSALITTRTAVATVSFKVIGVSGEADLSFDFTPGATDDSNVAAGDQDVLSSAVGALYSMTFSAPATPGIGAGGDTSVPEATTPAIGSTGTTGFAFIILAISIFFVVSGSYLFKTSA